MFRGSRRWSSARLHTRQCSEAVLILLCLVVFRRAPERSLTPRGTGVGRSVGNQRIDKPPNDAPLVQVADGGGRVLRRDLVRTTKSSQPHIVTQPSAAASATKTPWSRSATPPAKTSTRPAATVPPRSFCREASRRPYQNEEPYYRAAAPA